MGSSPIFNLSMVSKFRFKLKIKREALLLGLAKSIKHWSDILWFHFQMMRYPGSQLDKVLIVIIYDFINFSLLILNSRLSRI